VAHVARDACLAGEEPRLFFRQTAPQVAASLRFPTNLLPQITHTLSTVVPVVRFP
jgi:hypothetical protein